MIDLSQYPKFQQDIQNKHTNIYPIIRIDEAINISTVKETIDGVQYFDYGLSVSNVKESIDISKRNFKISNVTISLNNYPDQDVRLSDTIYNYINKYVEIFYKSQSCVTLDDCLPVYRGLLKGVKYNDKTITITLEDLTEKSLHKEVPIANLGYSENVYSEEYKNKYIPITYGDVGKAPAVIYRDGNDSEGRIYIISDNIFGVNNPAVEITGLQTDDISLESNEMGNIESPFYIYKDNYFRVLEDASTVENSIGSEFESQQQFRVSLDSNSIYIDKEFNLSTPINPPSDNYLECVRVAFPNDVRILKSEDGETFESEEGHTIALINPTSNSLESIIDNPNVQNESIVNEENFLNTQGQIPNNEITIDNTESFDNYIVHEFTPHRNGDYYRNRLWYPVDGVNLSTIFNVVAWCWSAAHILPIKFVEFPCADLIKITLTNWLAMNTFPQPVLLSGRSHYFRPQTRYEELRGQWEEFNEKSIVDGEDVVDYDDNAMRDSTYPSSVYRFITNEGQSIWVGQWESITMVDDSWLGDDIFLNIFPDNSEYPSLFDINYFAVFDPTTKVYEGTTKNNVYGMKYRSNYNNISIGNENNTTTGATCIVDENWLTNTYRIWGYEPIRTIDLCSNQSKSWFLYFPDEIEGETVMSESVTSDNRPYDNTLNTTIKSNTFIPCNHYQKYRYGSSHGSPYQAGFDFWKDYAIPDNPSSFTLGSGSTTNTGEKLIISMSFSDLGASNAVEGTTRTFPYGKLNCVFNPSELDTPNTVSGDEFSVLFSATNIEGDTINFTEDSDFGTKLIAIQGGDELNTHNEQGVVWSNVSEENDNHFQWDEVQGKITAWDTPDTCDSIALSYSLISDSLTNVTLETNISAIGIMQFITFENALDSNLYLDTLGRANSINDIVGEEEGLGFRFKYTDEIWTEDSSKTLIENPADIMYHFIEKELGQVNITDRDLWREARQNNHGINLGFSVNEKIDSKELFKKISSNCNIIPRFRQNGDFGFTSIKTEYASSDFTVKSEDVVSFGISYTPVNEIYTLVNVKYKKDYEEDEYIKQTGYCDGYDFFGNGDNYYTNGYRYDYYGLERDENILEFESDFIRNKQSADNLRDFLYMYHCNHHAIAKATLPLKYSHLELGDIIQFDKIVNNIKSLGEDYTIENTRNGQTIYPYFMVTSVTKSPKNIKIEATQLHRLVRSFTPAVGSLSRTLNNDVSEEDSIIGLTLYDYNILYDIILNEEDPVNKYITSEQKRVSDLTSNGNISLNDLNMLGQFLGIEAIVDSEEYTSNEDETDEDLTSLLGDINNDGTINVVDVVMLVNFILETTTGTSEQLDVADYNEDGTVNVVDIVNIVHEILGLS